MGFFLDFNIFNIVKDQLLSADSADVRDEIIIEYLFCKLYARKNFLSHKVYTLFCKILSLLSTVT